MNTNTNKLVKSALFLSIAIVFQSIGRAYPQISQSFVGPAVNAVLILTTLICGTGWGVAVGALTPLLAYMTGQLQAAMGPFLPFIMIGNIIFVLCAGLMRKYKLYGKEAGILIGSVLKFAFLYFSAVKLIYVFGLNIKAPVAQKLAIAMGYPQLITALVGGAVALILIRLLEKRKVLTS